MLKRRLIYFYKHWKVGIHLIFRTKRFGVNNQLWSSYDSMFGYSFWGKLKNIILIRPFIENYKFMKLRAGKLAHFLTDEDYYNCFGEDKEAWFKEKK